jgi:hypothetical protein
MKITRAALLTLLLATSVFAGNIDSPGAIPTPTPPTNPDGITAPADTSTEDELFLFIDLLINLSELY